VNLETKGQCDACCEEEIRKQEWRKDLEAKQGKEIKERLRKKMGREEGETQESESQEMGRNRKSGNGRRGHMIGEAMMREISK
jgi:hypothetical protein